MPHVSECTHNAPGTPTQFASEVSNICTYTRPTSRRTHSSNTSMRNRPYPPGETDRSVTWSPTGIGPADSRSTIGISCTKSAPSSSRRNVYTARPWSSLAWCTVVSAFHRTSCRFSTSRPTITRSKVGLPPLSTR